MSGQQIDCATVLDQLELYLDGELPPERLALLQEHIAVCFPCADRSSFSQQLRALVRDRCAEQAPPALVSRIRDHLTSTAR